MSLADLTRASCVSAWRTLRCRQFTSWARPLISLLRLSSSALQRLLYLFSCEQSSCLFFSHEDVRHASSLLHAANSIRASSACGTATLHTSSMRKWTVKRTCRLYSNSLTSSRLLTFCTVALMSASPLRCRSRIKTKKTMTEMQLRNGILS